MADAAIGGRPVSTTETTKTASERFTRPEIHIAVAALATLSGMNSAPDSPRS
jgi:hypothetical protein